MSNNNDSINTLIGTFSSVDSIQQNYIDQHNLIAIDTSFNRIGINILDPSYSIHIMNNDDLSGIIYTPRLIIGSIRKITDSITDELENNEIYCDGSNNLKINYVSS